MISDITGWVIILTAGYAVAVLYNLIRNYFKNKDKPTLHCPTSEHSTPSKIESKLGYKDDIEVLNKNSRQSKSFVALHLTSTSITDTLSNIQPGSGGCEKVMNDCVRCGQKVIFTAEDNDLICPSCGWGQKAAIHQKMETLREYNNTFFPRFAKLAAMFLIGLPICLFFLWLSIPGDVRKASYLSKYGKATTAIVVESKYAYSRRKSRMNPERIPVYYNIIDYDGHRNTIASDNHPYQIGHAFAIIYYPQNPQIYSRTAKQGDSSLMIFLRDISFLGVFALLLALVLGVILLRYTWATIQLLKKHRKLKLDLELFN